MASFVFGSTRTTAPRTTRRAQLRCVATMDAETMALPKEPQRKPNREITKAQKTETAKLEPSQQRSSNQPLTSFEDLATRFFDKGAETLKDSKQKPLKINRDLLLYRVKTYRRKGIASANRRKKVYWFQKAENGYRKVMRMGPTDCRAYVGLGRLCEMQKRFDEARKIYEDGCTVSAGQNAFLWTSRGNLEVKQNHIDTAREFFKAAIAADRTHEAAWHALGSLEKSIRDYATARDCWMKGIRYAKRTPSPYLYQSLALLAEDLELYDEARTWFRQGTQTVTGASSYVIWTAWALMEAKDGNIELMEQLFLKSLELNAKSRYSYLSWGKIEQERGEIDKARELFLNGHQKNKSDPALLQALAILESQFGDIEDARRYFRKSLNLDSGYQYTWQAWGVMESRIKNYDKARKLFQRGVWADPNSKNAAVIFHAWGLMEEAAGNVEVARTLYKYGNKVDPKNEALWKAWIQLEEKEENYETANELRNFSFQERTQIALPRNFSTLDEKINIVEDFLVKFSDWLSRRKGSQNE